MTYLSTELDNPWKDVLEVYLEEFMIFFFPEVHNLIDWSRGYEFLDQELQQVVRDAELGRRFADRLVKVWLKTGLEAKLYIHIEVQGQFEENFAERIFVYHYRLFDRYKQPLISLVVFGDEEEDWQPNFYGYELAGCRLSFEFPTTKLLDFKDEKKWAELEKSNNPFSIVVRTHLKALETRWSPKKRLQWKKNLFRALYEANYTKKEILELFRFLDWVLALPAPETLQFKTFTTEYEEKKKMPYVTSIERLGIEKGMLLGSLQKAQTDVVEVLRVRFKEVHESLEKAIHAIYDSALLSKLHREAILVESLEAFEKLLKKPDSH
jgi:hypothetical protein